MYNYECIMNKNIAAAIASSESTHSTSNIVCQHVLNTFAKFYSEHQNSLSWLKNRHIAGIMCISA